MRDIHVDMRLGRCRLGLLALLVASVILLFAAGCESDPNPWLNYRDPDKQAPPPSQWTPEQYNRAMMIFMMGQQGMLNSTGAGQYQRQPMTYCNPQGAGMVCWSE